MARGSNPHSHGNRKGQDRQRFNVNCTVLEKELIDNQLQVRSRDKSSTIIAWIEEAINNQTIASYPHRSDDRGNTKFQLSCSKVIKEKIDLFCQENLGEINRSRWILFIIFQALSDRV